MSHPEHAALISEAIEHHRAGRVAEAREIYARVLAENPDSPEALNFLAVMHVQYGDPKLAVALLQRAIEIEPYYAAAHSNLGNALVEIGHTADARTAYENALVCDPAHAEAHNNLGVLLRYQGDLQGSVAHLMVATSLEPEWATAQLNLGNTFSWMRYPDKALDAYAKAVEFDPTLIEAYRMMGHAFYARGDVEKTARVYRQLLSLEPGNPIAEHMLAATTGVGVPGRASRAYVEQTFDGFAASFDEKLERLGYRGPQLVAGELARLCPEPARALRLLDLGAGTGLCGPLVAPWAAMLVGVDLSPKMLQRAERRAVYDQLVVGDLETYLRGDVDPFDAMVSADVVIYFGALDGLLFAAHRRLAPGGWLIFTAERARPESEDGYELLPHGRYAHGGAYVDEKLCDAGFEDVSRSEQVLRREMGESVAGWLVSARRPPAA